MVSATQFGFTPSLKDTPSVKDQLPRCLQNIHEDIFHAIIPVSYLFRVVIIIVMARLNLPSYSQYPIKQGSITEQYYENRGKSHAYRILWQTVQIQSVPLTLYSRHALHTLALQTLQNAPRFMILPSSALQRPHAREGSGVHRPRLPMPVEVAPGPPPTWVWPGVAEGPPLFSTRRAPFLRSMANSDLRRLQQKDTHQCDILKGVLKGRVSNSNMLHFPPLLQPLGCPCMSLSVWTHPTEADDKDWSDNNEC